MATQRIFNLTGLNLYTNPILRDEGQPIHCVNMVSDPMGAKTKRSGYDTFLGTANGSAVTDLFSWTKDDGSLLVYRNSGGLLYYSTSGTGVWTIAGNGTVTAGNHVGYAILNNTLILGDGAGSTRHTTNGTSFTDTTLAPVGEHFAQYLKRVYIGGTASTVFYSTSNDVTNWNTSGTSDSSSFNIHSAGKINKVFKCADRLVGSKTSGEMFRWDGLSILDMSTNQGLSSPYSVSQKEGFYFYLNRDGIVGYGGERPKIISNAIQSQIYNTMGSAIAGSNFDTLSGVTHHYDYYLSAGTITDTLSRDQINNCVIKYDFMKNEFTNYSIPDYPTTWHSFKDANGVQQLVFGDSTGQCYKFVGTATTDDGVAIECKLEFVVDMTQPENDKLWRWVYVFTNPGCQAKCQLAFADTYRTDSKNWIEIGDLTAGVTEFRIPTEFQGHASRSKFMFVKFYETSKDMPFTLYGFVVDADIETAK